MAAQLDAFISAQTQARASGQQALRQWLLDAGLGEAGTTAAMSALADKGVGSPDELRDKWHLARSCIALDACRKVDERLQLAAWLRDAGVPEVTVRVGPRVPLPLPLPLPLTPTPTPIPTPIPTPTPPHPKPNLAPNSNPNPTLTSYPTPAPTPTPTPAPTPN